MTLTERLRQECDILRLMQAEHLRLAQHNISLWKQTNKTKYLSTALKSNYYWEFNREKIEWIEELLKEYGE